VPSSVRAASLRTSELVVAARSAEFAKATNSSQHWRGEDMSTKVNTTKKIAIKLYSLHWKISLVCDPDCIISPKRSASIAVREPQSQLLLISTEAGAIDCASACRL